MSKYTKFRQRIKKKTIQNPKAYEKVPQLAVRTKTLLLKGAIASPSLYS
jgi:hypothetical protein